MQWVDINDIDLAEIDARIAIGNAMFHPATDPSIMQSGAMHVIHNYVGTQTQAELRAMLGPDWENQLNQIRGLMVNNHTDDWLDDFRHAMVLGEPLPYSGNGLIADIVIDQFNAASRRAQGLLYPDKNLLRMPVSTSREETILEAADRMRRYMSRPDYQPSLASMVQMAYRDGVRIARPLPANQLRLYTMGMDLDALHALADAGTINPAMLDDLTAGVHQALLNNKLGRELADEVVATMQDALSPNSNWRKVMDRAVEANLEVDSGLITPLAFADPNLARDVERVFKDVLGDGVYLSNVDVPWGYAKGSSQFTRIGENRMGDVVGDWSSADIFASNHYLPFNGSHRLDGPVTEFREFSNGMWHDMTAVRQMDETEAVKLIGDALPTGRSMLVDGVS
jgi:hypothetical protein